MFKWDAKTKQFVIDITAWLGAGIELALSFFGIPPWGIAIGGVVVAAAISIEGLIPVSE